MYVMILYVVFISFKIQNAKFPVQNQCMPNVSRKTKIEINTSSSIEHFGYKVVERKTAQEMYRTCMFSVTIRTESRKGLPL